MKKPARMPKTQKPSTDSLLQAAEQAATDGQFEQAEKLCNQASELGCDPAKVYYTFGKINHLAGRTGVALNSYLKAHEADPQQLSCMLEASAIYIGERQPGRAIPLLKECLSVNKNTAIAYYLMGRAYELSSDRQKALKNYERAHAISPSNPDISIHLANAVYDSGKHQEGLALLQKTYEQNPSNLLVLNNVGNKYLDLGENVAAEECFRKILKIDSSMPSAFYNLARCKKWSSDNLEEIHHFEALLDNPMNRVDRQALHFALGKIYNDCKIPEKAFDHFKKGNQLATTFYRHSKTISQIKDIKAAFDAQLFSDHTEYGTKEHSPIFIVGFPRSGSTLVEQILSTDDNLYSVGESGILGDVTNLFSEEISVGTYKGLVKNIDVDTSRSLAQEYIDATAAILPPNARCIDKSLFNFLQLGLIYLLFPNAKVVHTVRNPLDCCLSCYTQQFSGQIDWAYELKSIGTYYVAYRNLMDYWDAVLPNPVHTIVYEELVAEPEKITKLLFDYCGLEWTPEALEFHKSRQFVATASNWQVRQPVYRSSVARWHAYAPHLEPLASALGSRITAEERQIIKSAARPKAVRSNFLGRIVHRMRRPGIASKQKDPN